MAPPLHGRRRAPRHPRARGGGGGEGGGEEEEEEHHGGLTGLLDRLGLHHPHPSHRRQGAGPDGTWPMGPTRTLGPVVLSQDKWRVGAEIATPIRKIGVMTQELFDVLPPTDIFENTTFRTCAVLGSAGILLLRKLGRAIDAHDAVFRFNCATTHGLADFVGKKTTIRLVNRDHVGFRETPQEVCIQQISTEIVIKQYENIRTQDPAVMTYAMDPMFSQRVIVKKSTPPTNGFYGIKLALELCDQVVLYGFIRRWQYLTEEEPPRSVRYMDYHYHDDYNPKDSQAHRDSKEWPLITQLIGDNPGRIHVAHQCVLDPICKGCPRGAECRPGVPFPVPSPGYCYGHGLPFSQETNGAPVRMPQADERRACFRKCKFHGMCNGGVGEICQMVDERTGCEAWQDERLDEDTVQGWSSSDRTLVDVSSFRVANASGVIAQAEAVRIRMSEELFPAPPPSKNRVRREKAKADRDERRSRSPKGPAMGAVRAEHLSKRGLRRRR